MHALSTIRSDELLEILASSLRNLHDDHASLCLALSLPSDLKHGPNTLWMVAALEINTGSQTNETLLVDGQRVLEIDDKGDGVDDFGWDTTGDTVPVAILLASGTFNFQDADEGIVIGPDDAVGTVGLGLDVGGVGSSNQLAEVLQVFFNVICDWSDSASLVAAEDRNLQWVCWL